MTAFPKTNVKCVDLTACKNAVALGCYSDGGKIFPAMSAGLPAGNPPAGITKAAFSKATDLIYLCADKKLYATLEGIICVELASMYCDDPTILEDYGENGLTTFALGDGVYVKYRGNTFTVKQVNLHICGGVMKNGRLFGVDIDDAYTVRWSGADGAFDLTEGINGAGWIKLDAARGKVLNLINYGEKLVAVREFGLTVISAFGTPENFKIEATDTGTEAVYKNTAAVAGGKLLFCAGSGIYAFDGNRISRLAISKQNRISNPSCAVALGERYFVCGFSNALERRAVLAYDAYSETQYLIDSAAETLVASDKVYCFSDGGAQTLEKGGSFNYICGGLDFDATGRKVLTSLFIDCDGEAEVTVESDEKTRVFAADKGRLRVDMCGSTFKISVKAAEEIRTLKAYAEVKSGV